MVPDKNPGKILHTLISFAVICLLFSCKKTDNSTPIEQPADLSKKVTASANGFVTNEQNAPVAGAAVQYGNLFSTTNQYGYFEIKNATVAENAAAVIVNTTGYFKGIKTFIARAGKRNFCRIKLIAKTSSGSVNATAGGDVTLPNGLKVSIPSNSVMDAATKTPYSETVNVASFWINPTAGDINEIMPGDLRGLNENGALKLLKSFGMAAIELTGNAGQLLQIADGKKATLTFPIPSSLAAAAPANIPLWSFDETKGLWEQEGNAVRSGNNYVGDVGHFSFWNCDFPMDYVLFNCTVHTPDGIPVPFASVRISVAGSSSAAAGYTDASGYTEGPIPDNEQLLLEVFPGRCLTPIYSQTFTTSSTNVSLDITIPSAGTSLATITGTVTNCANVPVTDGYIMMNDNNRYYWCPLSGNGTFYFPYEICNSATAVTFFAEDAAAGEQSSFLSYTLHAGDNAVGNLQACGITTEQFINYTLDGISYNYTTPAHFFYQYTNLQSPRAIYISYMDSTINTPTPAVTTSFSFTETGITAGSVQQLLNFERGTFNGTGAINVNITEFGAINQFIAGNFSGTVTSFPPNNTTSNVTCSFRLRRRQ